MNISQIYETKTMKCPTCLQNRRHVASMTKTFHNLELIKREKFINNINYSVSLFNRTLHYNL
jgi:hypothetical protein